MTVARLDSQSGSRIDYLARGGGGASQRDYMSRCGAQTLGGSVMVESLTALRNTPQWLNTTTTSTQSVSLSSLEKNLNLHNLSLKKVHLSIFLTWDHEAA